MTYYKYLFRFFLVFILWVSCCLYLCWQKYGTFHSSVPLPSPRSVVVYCISSRFYNNTNIHQNPILPGLLKTDIDILHIFTKYSVSLEICIWSFLGSGKLLIELFHMSYYQDSWGPWNVAKMYNSKMYIYT